MKKMNIKVCAVSLLAAMLLAGCSNSKPAESTTAAPAETTTTAAPADATTKADTADGGNTASAKTDGKPEKPTEAQFVKSTDAGNSGDVKLEKGDTYAVITVRDFGDIKVKLYPELAPYAVYNFVELAKAGTYSGRNFHRIMDDFMIQGGSANGQGSGGDSFEGGSFRNEINTSLRHYYGAFCYGSAMGDMSDQFYIVNNKKPQTDLDTSYVRVSNTYYSQAQQFAEAVNSLDPSDENYAAYYNYYKMQFDFSINYSQGAAYMYETITDDVKKTYEERGGYPGLDGGYTVFGQTVEGFDVIDKISAVEKSESSTGEMSVPMKDIIIDKVEIFTME
ncbi:MAG: peptidylprolyl isomerase [Ruminiclostridium sp.]|nr:peptidylprolyl isomerase [Ruminiclostridium sp.]